MPYKVLMIAPTSFFADYGCHVRILEETLHLQELGHRVAICTYHNGDDLPGLEIYRSWGVPWIKRAVVGSSRHKLYLDAMLGLRTLEVALRWRPDVIHAHLHEGALIGVIVGRLLGLPVLFDFQGSMTREMVDHNFLDPAGLWYRPLCRLERKINTWPQALVTSSYNAALFLREEFAFPDKGLFTVPDGVSTDRFRPLDELLGWPEKRAQLRSRMGIPADSPVVIYLGLLAPYQGIDVLLEAAQGVLRERPETYFLVMGYPGVDRYAALARSLGILERVLLPGRIRYTGAHRLLALGDVAVAPKMSTTEGSGKIINYMAMGLPVVTFDTPVSREILGELGLYAEYGSAESLARCLLEQLQRPEQGRRLGEQLRQKAVAEFSWSQRIHDVVALYRQIGAAESL
ncbi:MAG: glycosyltransferase family 4 protein [Chloroflexia bacterium]|nr:glycosyltransferase family 4 protein [Chloroflexia bacterium]